MSTVESSGVGRGRAGTATSGPSRGLSRELIVRAALDFVDRDGAQGLTMRALAHDLGLEVHAGHGLTYETVGPVAAVPELRELNIGHFLVGEAIFQGLGPAIGEMRRRMDDARDGSGSGAQGNAR